MSQLANGPHMAHYEKLLTDARVKGEAGVHLHLKLPQPPTSRLGFRGKKVKKSDAKLIAAKLIEAAKRDPSLIPAALNVARRVEGFKSQERAKQHTKKDTGKTTQQQIEEARQLVKKLEAEQLKVHQAHLEVKVVKVEASKTKMTEVLKPLPPRVETKFSEFELRQKLLDEHKAKLAADLKVRQFGNRINIKCRNSPG
jgi:predicted nuclease with TOPRIM domain